MAITESNNGSGDEAEVVAEAEPDRLSAPLDPSENAPRLPFTVVGVGASAGGLEAYTDFLRACKPDAGIAYVLIQHLSPKHTSIMAELLQKHTEMPVAQVEDSLKVEPNHVYVIRPGFTMTIHDGHLHLGEAASEPMHRRPVDDFFKSLAEEQRERAIAVILSGTGSNGTLGCETVKTVGGMCIAQEPESAKFPSMPRSLIDSHLADAILRPEEMFEAIRKYASHSYATGRDKEPEVVAKRERLALGEIIAVLRTRTRHDFSVYKKPTLIRRIQRRMSLMQIDSLSEYVRGLRQTPSEVVALCDDLMIHVTGFFRDPEVWQALFERVIQPLVAEKPNNSALRCWVTACSSGEEAYTIGILLLEAAEAAGKHFDIKIFATDTAKRSLSQARAGTFPGGIESEIQPDRLARFFDKDDSFYRVKKELRELVVFAPQNVLQDPPFSRLDLCTCRNLLIYIEGETQQRLLAMLHFGLREGGTLVLGNSETIAGAEDLFEPIDKQHRIYRRIGPTRHGSIDFPVPQMKLSKRALSQLSGEGAEEQPRPLTKATIAQLATKTLLDSHTPAAVVVDRTGQIVHVHGETDRFLRLPPGEPTRDIMMMAREEVRGGVRSVLQRAMTAGETVHHRDGTLGEGEDRLRVELTAAPLGGHAGQLYFLVSFATRPDAQPNFSEAAGSGEADELSLELRRVRDELQSTIEELQTSNEEMKASHEEVTSINEELQSTNEELETSKEELQSLNEELSTVNAQLQAKMQELERTSNDLGSLLTSTEIAVVFLDRKMRIRLFTPATKRLMDLIASDIGRPFADLARRFDDPALIDDARRVLDTLVPAEANVNGTDGRHYERRVLPYRTADDRIDGVVITFVDVSERRRIEQTLRKSEQIRQIALDSGRMGTWTWDAKNDQIRGDAVFMELYGFPPSDESFPLARFTARMAPEAAAACEAVAARELIPSEEFDGNLALASGPTAGRWVRWRGRVDPDVPGLIHGVSFDITEQKRADAVMRASETRLQALVTATSDTVYHMSGDWSEMLSLDGKAFISTTDSPTRTWVEKYIPVDERPRVQAAIRGAIEARTPFELEHRVMRIDGTEGWTFSRAIPLLTKDGTIAEWFGMASDITARKHAEARLRASETFHRTLAANLPHGAAFVVDRDLRYRLAEGEAIAKIGLSPAHFEGKTVGEVVPAEDAAMYSANFRRALAGESFRHEHQGYGRWFVTHGAPLRDAAGHVTGALAVSYDITALKQAEGELRAAKDVAESASQMKDEFLATLSHELRTPLSAILLWAKMLTARSDPKLLDEGLTAIRGSADAQKELIEDLLDTSRITTGNLRLEIKPTDLSAVIGGAVDSILPTAQAKGVSLTADAITKVGIVRVDPERIRQVLWNLLTNAVKFTPAGGTISVELRRRDGEVELRVSDTGKGIEPAFLPHVFELFRQADSTTTRRQAGLGLGLAICKKLVEQHGGTITAESDGPDRGATFVVTLPLRSLRPSELSKTKNVATEPSDDTTTFAGVRILIVEDDAGTRNVLSVLLRQAGAQVTDADSAANAMKSFTVSPPDLMISDIGMPDVDGYSLIRQIRTMETENGSTRVPAVALTAFADAESQRRALAAGFDQHLGKPIEPQKLFSVLQAMLKAQNQTYGA